MNKFNRSIKAIRMDNGKENINNMKSFLMFQGVQLEMTVPYTPQQNGCLERHNRILLEKAHTMLYAKALPFRLWAEAMNIYI